VHWLASTIIIGAGLFLCHQANKKGDALNYIQRSICLGVPIGFRILVFAFLPGFLILRRIENHPGCSSTIYLNLIVQLLFFWRLYYWIEVVSRGKSEINIVPARSGLEQSGEAKIENSP
jgi:hypothetical protein